VQNCGEMGAGASAGVKAGVNAASPDDLKAALAGLPDNAKEKLKGVLSSFATAEVSGKKVKVSISHCQS